MLGVCSTKTPIMSAKFEEKRKLILMTFLSWVTNSDEITEQKAIFHSVGHVPLWVSCQCWSEYYVCEFKFWCLHIFFLCIVFVQILIKIVHLYIIQLYVSKLLCGTHIMSNWRWLPKYADHDIWKRISNCCLSVKLTQSSNLLLKSNR
jgi:hypothetical protein